MVNMQKGSGGKSSCARMNSVLMDTFNVRVKVDDGKGTCCIAQWTQLKRVTHDKRGSPVPQLRPVMAMALGVSG